MTEKKYYERKYREIPPVKGVSKKPMQGLYPTDVINPDVEMTQADLDEMIRQGAFGGHKEPPEPEKLPDAYSGLGESKLIDLIRECVKYLKSVKAEEFASFYVLLVDGTVRQLIKQDDGAVVRPFKNEPVFFPDGSIFMDVPSYKEASGGKSHPVSLAASVINSCINALRGLQVGDGLKGVQLLEAMRAYRTYEQLIFALHYEPYVVAGMEQARKKQIPNKKSKADTDQLKDFVRKEAEKLRKANPDLYKKDTEIARKIGRDYPDKIGTRTERTIRNYLKEVTRN